MVQQDRGRAINARLSDVYGRHAQNRWNDVGLASRMTSMLQTAAGQIREDKVCDSESGHPISLLLMLTKSVTENAKFITRWIRTLRYNKWKIIIDI